MIEGITMRHRLIGLMVSPILPMVAASLTAAVPPPGKMPRIGVLWFGDPWNRPQREAFRHALRERGWVDGHTLRVEFRHAFFRVNQLRVQATELVRLPVDVIIATSGPATMAAQQATRTLPMVVMAGDPIGQGLVASLPHPGGNVTGVSDLSPELSAKRLERLKGAVQSITRVTVLWCPEHHVNRAQWQEAHVAARVLGLTLQSLEVQEVSDFAAVFATAARATPTRFSSWTVHSSGRRSSSRSYSVGGPRCMAIEASSMPAASWRLDQV
jgi:putative tryptophan/tyrosine transport system substrate-binding protein